MECPVCGSNRQRVTGVCSRCHARFDAPSAAFPAVREPRRAGEPRKSIAATAPVPELKFISVLFADLCGSTEQVSSFDPEEAQSYLVGVLSLMTNAVESYGGTVSQLFGDGLLALFGAPMSQEDHALRACLAAIAMQRRARMATEGGRSLTLRVGISSGKVIVGTSSELFAHQFRTDGSTMHLAARLEQLAAPGSVLVSGATMRLVGQQMEAVSLGAQEIRGMRGEVEVYELVTGGQRSAAAPLARQRQMSTMVGRAAILATMHGAAVQVRAGSMRTLALRGEPGIGKSRLVGEFCKQLANQFVVHCIGAHSYAGHVSYGVVTELVRELIGVSLEMEVEPQRTAARAIVAGWQNAERFHRAAISDLLDLGEADAEWAALMPASRRRHIANLVFWLITRKLGSSPMVIVIEDIFLADRDSERLIESLVGRLVNMPVLFCMTYRHDLNRRWMDAPWLIECMVGPLPPQDMTGLAEGILGQDDSLGPVIELLVERADGNPFFLEQLAITLIDNGTLTGAPRAYVCEVPEAELTVPGSIAGLISARVDRLPPPTKASLEAAAILGEPATSTMIATMRGIAPAEADNHLMLAVSLGLLAAPTLGDQPRYRFRHGLVQEVVAGALTRPRRKLLHRAAFVAMKAQQGDSSTERSALLVQHAYNGEDWAAATELALSSMKRSIARSANRDGVRVFELGMDAVKRLDVDDDVLNLELSLCVESLGAFLPLGKIDACIANLQRAESIALELGDVRRQAAVSLQMALIQWTKGSYAFAMEAADRAHAAADAAGSRSVQMAAQHARMTIRHGMGRYRDVAALARTIQEEFAKELAALELIHGWAVIAAINIKAFLADSLWRMAEVAEAQQVCDDAYRELLNHEHHFSRVLVDFVQGQVWIAEGRHQDAADVFSAALRACKANDNLTMVPVFVAALGVALARSGRVNEAIGLLEKGISDKLFLQGGRYNDFHFPMNLAIALAEAGRYADAFASAEAALAVASAYEQRGHQTQALFELAEIEVAAGRLDHALIHYRECASLAQECALLLFQQRAVARIEQVNESMRLLDGLQRRNSTHG